MSFLTVSMPDGNTVRFALETSTVRIGRSSDCELVLRDAKASRLHALLRHREAGDCIEDSGGRNGTFVNGWRLRAPRVLQQGDVIQLGQTELLYGAASSPDVEIDAGPLLVGVETVTLSGEELNTPPLSETAEDGGRTELSLLPVLLEADEQLGPDRPLNEIFSGILDLGRRIVPFERGVLMTVEGGELVQQIVRTAAREPSERITICRTIADRVLHRQESVLVVDALADEHLRTRDSVQMERIRSAMCVPIRDRQRVFGLLYVDDRRGVGRFTERNLWFLTHLANIAGSRIQNKRLYDEAKKVDQLKGELRRAAEMQRHLLPTAAPGIPGYRLHGISNPCFSVGGDYYDYIDHPGDRLGIALGDVSGRGLSAALLMCSLQSSVHALAEADPPLGDFMTRLNRILCRRLPDNMLITLFYGVLDRERHVLTYSNAGHNLPFVVGADGRQVRLPNNGPPLGVLDEMVYSSDSVALAPGDTLVGFSDGMSEAFNVDEEEFGEERIGSVAAELRAGSPRAIVEGLLHAVDRHCGDLPHEDDTTLVILKRQLVPH